MEGFRSGYGWIIDVFLCRIANYDSDAWSRDREFPDSPATTRKLSSESHAKESLTATVQTSHITFSSFEYVQMARSPPVMPSDTLLAGHRHGRRHQISPTILHLSDHERYLQSHVPSL